MKVSCQEPLRGAKDLTNVSHEVGAEGKRGEGEGRVRGNIGESEWIVRRKERKVREKKGKLREK